MFGSLHRILGFHTAATDGELGKVRDVLVDDFTWDVRYFVVDTGGWLRDHRVLVAPAVVLGIDFERELLRVDLSRRELENAPPLEREVGTTSLPYITGQGSHFARYWLFPVHIATPFGAAALDPSGTTSSNVATPHSPNRRLRSFNDLRHYTLHAVDGSIGSVDDLLVDTENWSVSHLVADTRRWLPSKTVVIEADHVGDVHPERGHVDVDLSRDQVREQPEYDPHRPHAHDEPGPGRTRFWT